MVDPVEIVLYLTARDMSYGALDAFGHSVRNLGGNIAGLVDSFRGVEAAGQGLAASQAALAAAQGALTHATADHATLLDLQARGITSAASAAADHANALRQLTAAQNDLNTAVSAEATHRQAAADIANVLASNRNPANGRFLTVAEKTTLGVQQFQQETLADAALNALPGLQSTASYRSAYEKQAALDAMASADLSAAGVNSEADSLAKTAAARRGVGAAAADGEKAATTLENALTGAGAFAARIAVPVVGLTALAGAAGGYIAEKQAVQFDASMQRVKALGDTSLSQAQLDQTGQSVLGLTGATGQDPKALADSLYYIASAGFKVVDASGQASDALKLLKVVAQDTTVAGLKDMTPATDALTGSLKAYGAATSQAADYNDTLVRAVQVSKSDMGTFARSFGASLAPAAQAGVPFPELMAYISFMTQNDVSAQQASQDMASLLRKVTTVPTKQATIVAADLGIELGPNAIKDQKGPDPLTSYLKDILAKTGGDPLIVSALFGDQRAFKVLQNTVLEGPRFDQALTSFSPLNRAGAGQTAYDTYMESNAGQAAVQKANIEAAAVKTGQKLEGLGDALTNLAGPFTTAAIGVAGAGAGGIGGAISGFSNFATNLANSASRSSIGLPGLDAFSTSSPTTQGDVNRAQNDFLAGSYSSKDKYQLSDGEKKVIDADRAQVVDLISKALSSADPVGQIKALQAGNTQFSSGIGQLALSMYTERQGEAANTFGEKASDPTAKAMADARAAMAELKRTQDDLANWKSGYTPLHLDSAQGTLTALETNNASDSDIQAAAKRLVGWENRNPTDTSGKRAATDSGIVKATAQFIASRNEGEFGAAMSLAEDTGQSIGHVQGWADDLIGAIKTEPGLTPHVLAQKIKAVRDQVRDYAYSINLSDAQTALKLEADGGTDAGYESAITRAGNTQLDYAAQRYGKNSPQYRKAQADYGEQQSIFAGALGQRYAGLAASQTTTDSGLGVSPDRLRADINAETAATIRAIMEAPGKTEDKLVASGEATDAGRVRLHDVDVQVAQQSVTAANTRLQAVQFEGQTLEQQQAALKDWEAALKHQADVAAGDDPKKRAQLESAAALTGAQASRATNTAYADNVMQAAQLGLQSAISHHDSAQTIFDAATRYAAAVDKDTAAKTEGLSGPAADVARAAGAANKLAGNQAAFQAGEQPLIDKYTLDKESWQPYAKLRADATALERFVKANGAKGGLTKDQIALFDVQTEHDLRGQYDARLRPPVYTDRPYQAPIGQIGEAFGSTNVLFASATKGASDSVTALMQQIASLQAQLAAEKKKEQLAVEELAEIKGLRADMKAHGQPTGLGTAARDAFNAARFGVNART